MSQPPARPALEEQSSSAYLSDTPVSLEEDDPFAHRDLAAALGSTLSQTRAPFTVGLFGPWGSGKSSVLMDVPHHLDDGCAWVTFDAWRYEGDTLRRNFLREVAEALADKHLARRHGRKYHPARELRDLDVDVQTTGRVRIVASTAYVVQALWAAIVFAGLAYAALQVDAVRNALSGDDPARTGPITVAVAVVSFAATYLGRVFQVAPETVSRRRVEDPERFMKLFIALLRRLKVPRLVIAIDNLDRCSPDRAVEVLSTIKTYLDPARAEAKKDVVYLIAVDVDALRRHLVAQENERSKGGDPSDGGERYVDEYLRKFFNAHLQIDDPRPDDMARYVGVELAKVRIGTGLRDPDRQRLIQVLAVGLRRNPRRVKQFLNNLELRLRLIRAREMAHDDAPPAIVRPISPQLLMIAKLAVIEEEHNRAFRQLVQQPHLLQAWDAAAAAVRPSGMPGLGHAAPALPQADPLDALLQGEDGAALMAFLRVTSDITFPDVRPFLRYKQSEQEREVPNYWELRDAAISGGREQLASLLSTRDDAAAFAAVLPAIFREEFRAKNPAGARSVVDVSLSVSALATEVESRLELLTAALGEPDFYEELRRLPAAALLDAARGVSDKALVERTADGVIDGLIHPDQPTRRRESAEAIAAHLGAMSEPQRSRLIQALQGPPVADDLAAVGALLVADPELATSELIGHVMATKLQTGPDGVRQVLAEPGLVTALGLAVDRRDPSNLTDLLATALPAVPTASSEVPPGEFARTLASAGQLLAKVAEANPNALNSYLTTAANTLGGLRSDQRDAVADSLLDLAVGADEGIRTAVVASTVSQVLSDPSGGGLTWVRARLTRLQALSATALGEQLQNAASTPRPDRDDLIVLAVEADPENRSGRAQSIAAQLSGQGDVAGLRKVLALVGSDLDESVPAFAQNLSNAWPGLAPDAQIQAMRLVREWLSDPPDEGTFAAFRSMVERGVGDVSDGGVTRLAAGTGAELSTFAPGGSVDRESLAIIGGQIVDAALRRAEAAGPTDAAALGLIDGLLDQLPRLSESERQRLVALLERWAATDPELVRDRYSRAVRAT
jgi:hypothetical protein